MKNRFFLILLGLVIQNTLFSQIRHDICDKIVIGDFKCLNCITSNQNVAKLMRNAVASHLNLDYTFCEVLNRDRLADILSRKDKEDIISSINDLTEDEKVKLTTIIKAQRVLFGEMEVQSDNSLLVTLIINNLGSGVQETTSIFEIPKGNYDTHSQREPHVNKGIERMLLGRTGLRPPVGDNNSAEEKSTKAISVKEGLVAFYPFNGNANDESGNKNHGIVSGAKLSIDRNGNPNSAYSFNGSTDFIMVNHSASICPANFTISLWAFLPNSTSNNYLRLISKHLNQPGSYGSYQILTGTMEAPLKCIGTAITNAGYIVSESNSTTTKGWHNLMMTWNGQTLNLYVDKVLVRIEKWAGNILYDSNPLYIGKDGFYSTSHFSGAVDDIRIYNRVLNEDEMLAVFEDK